MTSAPKTKFLYYFACSKKIELLLLNWSNWWIHIWKLKGARKCLHFSLKIYNLRLGRPICNHFKNILVGSSNSGQNTLEHFQVLGYNSILIYNAAIKGCGSLFAIVSNTFTLALWLLFQKQNFFTMLPVAIKLKYRSCSFAWLIQLINSSLKIKRCKKMPLFFIAYPLMKGCRSLFAIVLNTFSLALWLLGTWTLSYTSFFIVHTMMEDWNCFKNILIGSLNNKFPSIFFK